MTAVPLTKDEVAALEGSDRVVSFGGKPYDREDLHHCHDCEFVSPFETDFGPDQSRCWDCEEIDDSEGLDLLDIGHPSTDDAEWEGY